MGYDELKDKIYWHWRHVQGQDGLQALVEYRRTILAVVELHKPDKEGLCAMNCVDVDDDGYSWTQVTYPCPTIQAIEKELNDGLC